MKYLNTGFEIVGLTVGALLIYIALFLTESEEKTIENRLVDWWILIQDRQKETKSRLVLFSEEVARITSAALDRLLGNTFFGTKIITVSLSISLTPLVLAGIWFYICLTFQEGPGNLLAVFVLTVILLVLLGNLFGDPNHAGAGFHGVMCSLLILTILIVFIGAWVASMNEHPHDLYQWLGILAIIGTTVTSNCIVGAVTRWLLRLTAVMDSLLKILVTIVANYTLAFVFVVLPVVWLQQPNINGYLTKINCDREALVLGVLLIPIALPTAAFSLLAITMLIHRIAWPLLHRPIYALQRFGIFKRRRAVGYIGAAVVVTSPQSLGLGGPALDMFKSITGKMFG
jgi:hypothetical protein